MICRCFFYIISVDVLEKLWWANQSSAATTTRRPSALQIALEDHCKIYFELFLSIQSSSEMPDSFSRSFSLTSPSVQFFKRDYCFATNSKLADACFLFASFWLLRCAVFLLCGSLIFFRLRQCFQSYPTFPAQCVFARLFLRCCKCAVLFCRCRSFFSGCTNKEFSSGTLLME